MMFRPVLASERAKLSPAGPAPITATSHFISEFLFILFLLVGQGRCLLDLTQETAGTDALSFMNSGNHERALMSEELQPLTEADPP
jgi:hypothetical protein